LIEVEGLTKYYDERLAIQDLSFSIPRGQIVGFLGPKGAGKSTTMRILTGYVRPSAGKASISGLDILEKSMDARRRVGYLPETTPLYNDMRVAGFLDLVCKLRGVPPSKRRARVDHAVGACGLGDRRSEMIGRLSRDLRQRVGLAQAIVHEPDALLLDEPTAGLDPDQTREMQDLIKRLVRHHTVILASRLVQEVSATCERVLIIHQGRLVGEDTPDGLAEKLAGGRRHEVEMVVRADAVLIEERLRQVDGVDGVAITHVGEGVLRVVVTTARADLREDLARAVVDTGFGLLEMQWRAPTLDAVFLQLTAEGPA